MQIAGGDDYHVSLSLYSSELRHQHQHAFHPSINSVGSGRRDAFPANCLCLHNRLMILTHQLGLCWHGVVTAECSRRALPFADKALLFVRAARRNNVHFVHSIPPLFLSLSLFLTFFPRHTQATWFHPLVLPVISFTQLKLACPP